MQQVWANCRAYNPEGHPVRQMGDRLSDAWEKKWHASGIEGKWEDIMREEKADEVPIESWLCIMTPLMLATVFMPCSVCLVLPGAKKHPPAAPELHLTRLTSTCRRKTVSHAPHRCLIAAGTSDCATPVQGDGRGASGVEPAGGAAPGI